MVLYSFVNVVKDFESKRRNCKLHVTRDETIQRFMVNFFPNKVSSDMNYETGLVLSLNRRQNMKKSSFLETMNQFIVDDSDVGDIVMLVT